MSDKIEIGDVVEFTGLDGLLKYLKLPIEIGHKSQVLQVLPSMPDQPPGKYLVTTSHPWKLKPSFFDHEVIAEATSEYFYRKLPAVEKTDKRVFVLSDLGIKLYGVRGSL